MQPRCFFHTIGVTLIWVLSMNTAEPDFLADEFLLDHYVGKTPLVRLQRVGAQTQATILAKLEGNNPVVR